VAGTAALIISSNLPDVNDDGVVNNEDIRLQLQSTARDLGDPGKDDTYGYGLVKAPITAAAISCDCGDICVSTGGWWHDGGAFNASGAPIQDAVDNASSGDTICVAAGSYNENVDVETDHLTIQSENGSVSTIVQAANSGNHVFEVIANYVNISGLNVTGATGTSRAGIYLNGADQCNISDNTASGNWDGIYLKFSNDNILLNNTASNNDNYGIELYDSSDNLIYNNYWSNTNNVYDGGSNRWNTTVTPVTTGSNIIGGSFIGGNYWSDYTGADDGGGLGNIPYNITGGSNFDYHPLCYLSEASVKGDLNGDGDLTSADAAIALRLAATGAHDDAADVSGDGAVTSLDALMILQAAADVVKL
jgi:parallel beta-helix repeat protein